MLSTHFEQSSGNKSAIIIELAIFTGFRRFSFSDIENPIWGHVLNFIFIFNDFAFSEILLQILRRPQPL